MWEDIVRRWRNKAADFTFASLQSVKYLYRNLPTRTLVVVFSPSVDPELTRYQFGYASLHFADTELSYYTLCAPQIAQAIFRFSRLARFSKIILIGGSKGGYGALLIGDLLSKLDRRLKIGVVAFSPMSHLWPHNPTLLRYSSYKTIMSELDQREDMRAALERYGNLQCISGTRVHGTIVYGEFEMNDVASASRIPGENITRYPIKCMAHSTLLLFTANRRDRATAEKQAQKLFAAAQKNPELRAVLPDTEADLVRMVLEVNVPTLNEMIDRQIGLVDGNAKYLPSAEVALSNVPSTS